MFFFEDGDSGYYFVWKVLNIAPNNENERRYEEFWQMMKRKKKERKKKRENKINMTYCWHTNETSITKETPTRTHT